MPILLKRERAHLPLSPVCLGLSVRVKKGKVQPPLQRFPSGTEPNGVWRLVATFTHNKFMT